MAWSVSVVGAFDRFNYGDVLFSRISEHLIKTALPDAEIEFFALRRADLRTQGGVATRPLSELYRKRPPDDGHHLVMVAGGEVLAPTWAQMAEHLVPPRLSGALKRLHRRTGYAFWNPLWQRIGGCANRLPWTIDPSSLPAPDRTFICYNAVGGTSLGALTKADIAWQAKALSQAAWTTVRDAPTADAVVARGLPRPAVRPDSAVVMRDLLPPGQERRLRNALFARSGAVPKRYLAVQIARKWLQGTETALIDGLAEVHRKSGLQIVPFAIGRAAGHDDHVAADKICARLKGCPWVTRLPHDLTVSEIMALIAGADVYVGTSLHGNITAFAYNKPRVGLLPHLAKVVGFRDAWDLPEMPAGVEIPQLAGAVDTALSLAGGSAPAQAKVFYESSFRDMIIELRDAVGHCSEAQNLERAA
ncbi:MAG: polysaccharide pyruvyl transferase family protein [Alphaproteobacteria bacterium]|nr:polysaccharide pyruvyl transferase family protein [Alphaproteobacteria bacterium]NNF24947.1 polysaccharide pyruvyl transferase family protein [Paracoccaceae bacterium]